MKITTLTESLAEIARIITEPAFEEFIRDVLIDDEKLHYEITVRKTQTGEMVLAFDHKEQVHKTQVRLFTKLA